LFVLPEGNLLLPLLLHLLLLFFLSFPLGESASAFVVGVAVAVALLSVIPEGNLQLLTTNPANLLTR
jgi:hypothetical protein